MQLKAYFCIELNVRVRGIDLQVFVNYPTTDEGIKQLLDNLATFKAKLLLKSIENLNVEDKVKDEVLEKMLEILNSRPKEDVI